MTPSAMVPDSMTPLRPRQTSHRGSVMAAGLAIDTRITGEAEGRRRILQLPSRGLGVFRVGAVLAARFAEPVRLDAAEAGGAPLVRYSRLLAAAPLDGDEQDALLASSGAAGDIVVLVAGGTAAAAPLDDAVRVDASEWIDVSAFAAVTDLHPLGSGASEPPPAMAAPAATARQAFGIEPLAGEAAETLLILAGRRSSAGRHSGIMREGAFERVRAVLQAMTRPRRTREEPSGHRGWLAALRSFFAGARGASPRLGGRAGNHPGTAAGAPAASKAAPRLNWLAALKNRFARAVWSSQLARLLGRRYAQHLARVLAMLDEQDYDNALRNAVPLTDEVTGVLRAPPLGLPAARADLNINLNRGAAGPGYGLGAGLFDLLRQRYRRAFERLDATGDVDKAAFVLAELLNAAEEAVSYLERHGRLKLAAELAEARRLPPGLVIRLWFLAGDRTRAVHIARLTGAFADAVLRLEQSHKEDGRILRLMWADDLATKGLWAAAVDAVWPVAEARHLARAWIDRAIATGGPSGARMLARKAVLVPETFADVRDQALDLFRHETEDDTAAIRAFASALAEREPTAETRVLARPTVRRLLRDHPDADLQRLLDRLLKMADPTLAADVRAWQHGRRAQEHPQPHAPLRSRSAIEIMRPGADGGGVEVTDAAVLPDGRLLAATGDLGVFLLARDGKVIARFAEPAHRIVISDQGDRAILLARRGEISHISRLDLVTRRLRRWRDARVTQFAADFDGSIWFVACRDTIYAVDATAERWQHLWKVDERGAVVRSIARDERWMSVHLVRDQRVPSPLANSLGEVWTFELPAITLRRRQPVESGDDNDIPTFGKTVWGPASVTPPGTLAGWRTGMTTDEHGCLVGDGVVVGLDGRLKALPGIVRRAMYNIAATNDWIAFRENATTDQCVRSVVHLLDVATSRTRMRITIDGAGRTDVRIQANRLIVFDTCGRIIVVSLASGAVLHEHRLT